MHYPYKKGPSYKEVEKRVWKELYACPFCDFKTRIRDVMEEHLKEHPAAKDRKFNPSER